MTLFEASVLGLVQGLTEFLPVSSSGHLVLVQKLFGLEGDVLTFDIAVHLATLIAVLVIFRTDILSMIRRPFDKLPLLLVVGTLPAVAVGLIFKDIIADLFASGASLGIEFIFTGAILLVADRMHGREKKLEQTTWLDALVVGACQAIAILPAVSRSGLTLAGALFAGLNREAALRFSFLLSIPAILGGAVFDLKDVVKDPSLLDAGGGIAPILLGGLIAGIVGYFSIRFMLKVFQKASLAVFSYYVFALGAIILTDQLFFGKVFPRIFGL